WLRSASDVVLVVEHPGPELERARSAGGPAELERPVAVCHLYLHVVPVTILALALQVDDVVGLDRTDAAAERHRLADLHRRRAGRHGQHVLHTLEQHRGMPALDSLAR